MPIQVSIKVEEDNISSKYKVLPAQVEEAIGVAIQKSAFQIEREAKFESPVQTGRLRNSIASEIHPTIATIEPHVNYAIFVHEGTRYISANPFMQRASDRSTQIIDGFFEKAVEEALRK